MFRCWYPLLLALVTTVVALPADYNRISGKGFYLAVVKPAQWVDALKFCSEDRGFLVEVASVQEAETVGNVLRAAGVHGPAFVGIHNIFNHDVFHYISGSRVTDEVSSLLITNNVTVTKSCGAVDCKGVISMQDCEEERPFVCKLPLWRDYEYADGGYYRLSQEALTWEEARASCEKDGAHLVVIDSYQEARMLTDMLKRYPFTPESSDSRLVAVGVHDQFRDGFYITVKGDLLEDVGFSNWGSYESDNGELQENQHCVFLHRDISSLMHGSCEEKHAFICER